MVWTQLKFALEWCLMCVHVVSMCDSLVISNICEVGWKIEIRVAMFVIWGAACVFKFQIEMTVL